MCLHVELPEAFHRKDPFRMKGLKVNHEHAGHIRVSMSGFDPSLPSVHPNGLVTEDSTK